MKDKCILLGGGAHSEMMADLFSENGNVIVGYVAPHSSTLQIPYLGSDCIIVEYNCNDVLLINGIGGAHSISLRNQLYREWTEKGYMFAGFQHPSITKSITSRVSSDAHLLEGVIVKSRSFIGDNVLLNTRVIVEHHAIIEEGCHLAPGVIICGGSIVKKNVFIGAGTVVKQGVTIGENSIIGAHSLVLDDIPPNSIAYGSPCKVVKQNNEV